MTTVDDVTQTDVRRNLRAFLSEQAPTERVRRVAEGPEGHDRELWSRLCHDLEVASMCLPEEYGGAGAPWSFQAIVIEELGRTLAPVPFMSTVVLAATALRSSGDEAACRTWLPAIARGELVATVAAMEEPHDWDLARTETVAVPSGDGWQVSGVKRWVLDGVSADLALVLATTPDGPTLLAVDLTDPATISEPAVTLDATRPLAKLTFTEAPARLVGPPGRGREVLELTNHQAGIALAAEQLAGAQRAHEMAVAYAKDRVQFGRPIGSFQAIKHLLADQLVDNEALEAAVRYAATVLDEVRADELALLAHVCQAVASEAYVDAAGLNIQVHGGLGYTWEHDAHLYFKRATASRQWLGTPEHHREKLAALMLDGGPRQEEHTWNQ